MMVSIPTYWQRWSKLPAPPWPARSWASAVSLPGGRVLLLGGKSHSGNSSLADGWFSDDDGTSWEQLPPQPWPARRQASAVVLGCGAVILMAGGSDEGRLADVWRSHDGGLSWQQLPVPPWPARWQACATALPDGGVLLLAGESSKDGPLKDVWRSDDGGESWVQLPPPPWPARRQASAVVLPGGAVLLLAGWSGSECGYFDDAWRSDDGGVSWHGLPRPPWPPRYGAAVVAQSNGAVAVLGGHSFGAILADGWRSPNGLETWEQLPRPPWPPRVGASIAILKTGSALLVGGHGDGRFHGEGKFLGDAWRTRDRHDDTGEDDFELELKRMAAAEATRRELRHAMRQPMQARDSDEATTPSVSATATAAAPPRGQGACATSAGAYLQDDAVEYYAAAHDLWIPATVTSVDPSGRIMLNTKPGIWFSVEEQAAVIRRSPFSTRLGQSKHGVLGVSSCDREGRTWSSPQKWTARYIDAGSPETQVSPRSYKASRRGADVVG